MTLSKFQWGMIIVGILLIISLVLVYFFVLKKKSPKVVKGVETAFMVDGLGNVYDAQNLYVGNDNGDDSFTSPSGDIIDFNNNVIGHVPVSNTTGTAATPGGTTVVHQVKPSGNVNLDPNTAFNI